jgi:hypothetical protein
VAKALTKLTPAPSPVKQEVPVAPLSEEVLEEVSIPKTRDEDGNLLKLSRKDFLKGKAGNSAFIGYQIEALTLKKARLDGRDGPKAKLLRNLEKAKARQEKLAAQLKAMG